MATLKTLPHDQDTLLFVDAAAANMVLAALEDGFDQVVAICIDQVEPAKALLDDAEALELDLFVDAREIHDLGSAGIEDFPGAVCWPNQVKFLRKTLGAEATLVVDAGISRHDAMTGAENGANAVLFRNRADQIASEIYPEDDEGPQNVADLYAWWEQLMEPPAILDLGSLDETPSWMEHVEFLAVQATLA